MKAGRVLMTGFSDGVDRMVPASDSAAVMSEFPGTSVKARPQPDVNPWGNPEDTKRISGQMANRAYEMVAENMPAILGTALTLPFGGVGGLAGPALRTTAGATGAFGGSMVGDAMQGQAPDLGHAAQNFALGLGLGAGGEGIAAGARGPFARSQTKAWVRPTEKMLRENPQLVEDVLATRSKLRKPGEKAVEARRAKASSMRKTRGMVSGSTGSISVDDALAQVYALRDGIARSAPTDARLPLIDTFIESFKSKWGAGRVPVQEAHPMKLQAQREASARFAADSPGAATSAELNKLVSQDVRKAIGREIPPTRGSRGYNKQDEITQRAHDTAVAVERAARLKPPPPAMTPHMVASAAGGLGGFGAGGPAGGMGGMLAANAMLRALENPAVANRMALMATNPVVQRILMNAPRFGAGLIPEQGE